MTARRGGAFLCAAAAVELGLCSVAIMPDRGVPSYAGVGQVAIAVPGVTVLRTELYQVSRCFVQSCIGQRKARHNVKMCHCGGSLSAFGVVLSASK